MTLRERWGGWQREPFTSESRKHVSVWQKNALRALPAEGTLRLSFPEQGLLLDDLLVRLPRPGDEDAVAAAFADEELREAGNLPQLSRDELARPSRTLRSSSRAAALHHWSSSMPRAAMSSAAARCTTWTPSGDAGDRLLAVSRTRAGAGSQPGLRGPSPSTRSRSVSSA